MLEVGKAYSAELHKVKFLFTVSNENDVTWAINIVWIKGTHPGVWLGEAHVSKFSAFFQTALINELEGEKADDLDSLDILIDMSLEVKNKAWFYTLTNQKKEEEMKSGV